MCLHPGRDSLHMAFGQGANALASSLLGMAVSPVLAAEREQVRMVINLISGVKMPYPENLRNNQLRERL